MDGCNVMDDKPELENVEELERANQEAHEKSNEVPKQAKNKLINLPISRVKQIIKMDPEVTLASSDAVFLIAKSAELFIGILSKQAYEFTSNAKKKTIQRKDVDSAIDNIDEFAFLEGALD